MFNRRERPSADWISALKQREKRTRLIDYLSSKGIKPGDLPGREVLEIVMYDLEGEGVDFGPNPEELLVEVVNGIVKTPGGFILSRDSGTLFLPDDRVVELTPTENKLMYELVLSPHKVVSYHRLLSRVWSRYNSDLSDGDLATLRACLSNLRSKLGDYTIMYEDEVQDYQIIRVRPGYGLLFTDRLPRVLR